MAVELVQPSDALARRRARGAGRRRARGDDQRERPPRRRAVHLRCSPAWPTARPASSCATAAPASIRRAVGGGPPRAARVDHRPDGAAAAGAYVSSRPAGRRHGGRAAPAAKIPQHERPAAPRLHRRRPPVLRSGVRAGLARCRSSLRGDAPRRRPATVRAGPDVVLLDVHMPGGGGVEILRRVTPREAPFFASSPCPCPTCPKT